MADIIITEDQYNRMFSLITEDRESKNLAKARNVVRKINPNADANKFVNAIRHDIPNSRINQCKYLPGVARMVMNGEVKDGITISELNVTLKLIGTAHDNEYDGNLNNEQATTLITRFRPAVRAAVEAKKEANSQREYTKRNDYKVVPIPSFEEAKKYGQYTSWCVTHDAKSYDSYTHGGLGIFYFLLKDGFEDVPQVKGAGCPLDEYGLSMIAVSINEDGSINTSTCRWNHANGGNDDLFTDEKISELLGGDVYQILKPRNVKILADTDRFRVIQQEEGKIVAYDRKLDRYTDFAQDGTAPFMESFKNPRTGRIDLNGNIVIQPKYFAVWSFESDGCAKVLNYSYGLVTRDGKEIFDIGPQGKIDYLSSASEEGTRLYRDDNGERGLINMRLNKHIKPGELSMISELEPDNKFIVISNDKKTGLLNADLSWAIPLGTYDDIGFMDKHDMLRTVSIGEEEPNILYGLVNEKNELVLPLKFHFIFDECTMGNGEKVYGRPVVMNYKGKRIRGRAYKDEDGSVYVKWRNGQIEHYYPQKLSNAITESVYVNGINNKQKKATLTYSKGNSYQKGSKNYFDNIKTDKMDTAGSDTYEVPLKGGIMSYNITSIKGTEVMHYFKRYWDNQKTKMKIGADEYELDMQQREFDEFMNQFNQKVNYVVNYCYQNFKHQNPDVEFSGVSIYPVPSSSHFNENMASEMKRRTLIGLPIQVINKNLLLKDLRTLQKDDDFVKNNQEYYNTDIDMTKNIKGSVEQHLDMELNKYNSKIKAYPLVSELNDIADVIIKEYYYINARMGKGLDTEKRAENLANAYRKYAEKLAEIKESIKYFNPIEQKNISARLSKAINPIKYTKGPSVDKRSDNIWSIVKKYLRGSGIQPMDIQRWQISPFEIKPLPNGVRMGLKGMYNPNTDFEIVKKELDKIKGTIFVVFDDNISGGSTLSDVCSACKQMGIQYIIPITFGEMETKWGYGVSQGYKPINSKGEIGKFNYGLSESINEEKIVAGKMYMHKSQAERIIPTNIYNAALQVLRNNYPDYQYNCVMYAPKANIVRFDYSEDFNTNTEPSITETVTVNYVTGKTKVGRPTPAVWHERSFWVDNNYDGFDRDKDREWVQTYRNAIKQKPYYGKNPQGGSRAAWMNHLMNLRIIDKYFEVNNINNPEEYLNSIKPSPKFPRGYLLNKYRKKFQK